MTSPAFHRRLSAAVIATALILPSVMAGGSAAAANDGRVILRGAVDTDCALLVNDHGKSVDIVNGVSNFTLGSVGESCNSGSGYTVTLSSANNGLMLNERGDAVGYSINWHDSGLRDLTAPVVLTRTGARPFLTTRSFRVTVPATPQAIAGDYSDLITMTIAAR